MSRAREDALLDEMLRLRAEAATTRPEVIEALAIAIEHEGYVPSLDLIVGEVLRLRALLGMNR